MSLFAPAMTPIYNSSLTLRLSDSILESHSKVDQPKDGDQTQQARQRLPTLDSSWNGRSSQNDRSEEGKLDAIGLAITDSKTTEDVLKVRESVFVVGFLCVHVWGEEANQRLLLTRRPTEQPATTEGIDPVRTYPVIPPPATRKPTRRAIWS